MFKRKTRSKKNKIHFCHFRQIIILSFVCTNNHLSTSTAVVTKTKHYHFFTDLKSQDTYTIWTLLRCKLFVKWGKKTSLLHLGSLPVTSVGPLWFNTKVLTSSQGYRTLSCKKKMNFGLDKKKGHCIRWKLPYSDGWISFPQINVHQKYQNVWTTSNQFFQEVPDIFPTKK